MPKRYRFKVSPEYQGYTLYDYLVHHLMEFSSSTIRKMLYNNLAKVNQEMATSTTRLVTGDRIQVSIPDSQEHSYPSSLPKLEILFENEDFLVINKPSGLAVVQERWLPRCLLKEALLAYLQKTEGNTSLPRIVHRIDKEASGALVVAKTSAMEKYLAKIFEQREVEKEYLAIVVGIPPKEGSIETNIAPASKKSNRMIVSEFGKSAITHYKRIETFHDFALLQVKIETGRTHQIRVHLASQGYPLAVDSLYGYRSALCLSELKPEYKAKKNRPEKPLISRLTLHSHRIGFRLPDNEEKYFSIEAPLPKDFQRILKMLRKYRRS